MQEQARQGFRAEMTIDRHKKAQAPRNNLAEEAEALELINLNVAESRQLNALGSHHARCAQGEAATKLDRMRAGQEMLKRIIRGEGGAAVKIEDGAKIRDFDRRDQASDNALSFIGLQAIDLARRAREMLPDGKQKASDEMDFTLPMQVTLRIKRFNPEKDKEPWWGEYKLM